MSVRVIMMRRTLARMVRAGKTIGLPRFAALQNRAFLLHDPGSQ
jgi:hypothetical protein